MTIAKHTFAAIAIFGVGLFFGCIITAKSLEFSTPLIVEKPLGAALFPVPIMPPIPQYSTPKLAKNSK